MFQKHFIFFFCLKNGLADRVCRKPSLKEWFPKKFCDVDQGESWFTPGRLGNYEPSPPPPQGGRGVVVKGAESSLDLYQYGMSMLTSDTIPLDRAVKDVRHSACKFWNYPPDLPQASVIIVFHNEGLSVLLRTVVSVLERSPPHLLQEVLLVDDHSLLQEFPRLGQELEKWIESEAGRGLVRLVRNPQRAGLIRSKNRGAAEARGAILVFLDAHCEVNTNWLTPLLTPIHRDSEVMTVPLVDSIDPITFRYSSIYQAGARPIGTWEWGLLYKEICAVCPELGEGQGPGDGQPEEGGPHLDGRGAQGLLLYKTTAGSAGGLRRHHRPAHLQEQLPVILLVHEGDSQHGLQGLSPAATKPVLGSAPPPVRRGRVLEAQMQGATVPRRVKQKLPDPAGSRLQTEYCRSAGPG